MLFPKSKYGYRRYSYALATRCIEAITPSWLQPEAKEMRGRLDSLIFKAASRARDCTSQQGLRPHASIRRSDSIQFNSSKICPTLPCDTRPPRSGLDHLNTHMELVLQDN